ncbi:7-keto-8-aminopelargonate synthetase-like enzyme [Bradyrhizobium sp. LB14.3]
MGRVWIVVESLYSMDGDFAPLDDVVAIANQHDAFLMAGEAHATGVYGAQRGGLTASYAGRETLVSFAPAATHVLRGQCSMHSSRKEHLTIASNVVEPASVHPTATYAATKTTLGIGVIRNKRRVAPATLTLQAFLNNRNPLLGPLGDDLLT